MSRSGWRNSPAPSWSTTRAASPTSPSATSLSSAHRRYLASGGRGFFIGDGALDYAPEAIVEAFYAASLRKGLQLTLDYQRIRNPAYNAARGPVAFTGLRAHFEF